MTADAPTGPDRFVEWFRATAPYIHAHRGRTFVVVFGGELLLRREATRELVQDVALLTSLGVRVVLVAGARPQIDARLERKKLAPRFVDGARITDAEALTAVKEAVGTTRVELEALMSMGLPSSPMAGARMRIATGNFVTARPVGIIDGTDFGSTGEVRRVDADAIRQRLDAGAVVLLGPIGYSLTGEIFNMSTPEVAAETAVALRADKLICLVEGAGLVDGRGRMVQELTLDAAEEMLGSRRRLARDVRRHLASAVHVCRAGIDRAHLVPRKVPGALLRELYTREGGGTMLTATSFEGVRSARPSDVGDLLALLQPLEERGILVRRSQEVIERDIERFTVIEREGRLVACAALHPYPDRGMAELACLAVDARYRHAGRGDVLLQYLEKRCVQLGLPRLFVLTTQTSHWFQERGFDPVPASQLPPERPAYDPSRKSRVLVKHVG